MKNKAFNRKEYDYPIDDDWSTAEIIDVIYFFQCVEASYEKGIARDKILSAYRRLKEIVPSKAEEKKLNDQFEQLSGYSPYKTMKRAKEKECGRFFQMHE
ncbi:UPF0223 family protein [Bacillus aquiflavi]|uniref:UPF0223 protein G4D64_11825 n=1 Tax=Bacillus aquiflavi TaxID=2672567 RepID=A0A6B3VZ35_9BACI|nr:UPF0223 family protein [Bacillus aquiflavi]MBA4537916.1 UPF0223 family protein [Bacillus aquiflavi]NEY82172.1 UPF0223 family protein [Bacillus aquiflavi]UAC49251.1 UPF0223 family protein [Bacillus aquiflavi]